MSVSCPGGSTLQQGERGQVTLTGQAPVYLYLLYICVCVRSSLQHGRPSSVHPGEREQTSKGQEGCLGTRHGSHMGSGSCLVGWVITRPGAGYAAVFPASPNQTRRSGPWPKQSAGSPQAASSSGHHVAEEPGKHGCGTVAAHQPTHPYPAQAPDRVCFDWSRRPLPSYHHLRLG